MSDIVDPVKKGFLIQFTKCVMRKCQQVTANITPRFNSLVFLRISEGVMFDIWVWFGRSSSYSWI